MPFSGTFQSLNVNGNLVLNDVLNNITFTSGQSFEHGRSSIRSLWVQPGNGRNIWLGERGGNNDLYGYTSSSAWDISSVSDNSSLTVNSRAIRPRDFSMSPDGVYALSTTDKSGTDEPIGIKRVTASTAYRPGGDAATTYRFAQEPFNNTSKYTGATDAICGYYKGTTYRALCIANDGQAATVKLTTDTTPNTIDSKKIGNLHSAATFCKGCVILYDGQKLLTCSGDNQQIHEFDFGTAYDITTLSYVQSVALLDLVPDITSTEAIWTDKDDPYTTGIYIVSNGNSTLYRFNVNGSKYSQA